jgi:hypothetical protein
MRIQFEQTGGFMGRTVSVDLNLEELPVEQADQIRKLIDQADFINLGENLSSPSTPDAYSYRITVETDVLKHTVSVGDASAPDSLRPLIQELSQRARTAGRA